MSFIQEEEEEYLFDKLPDVLVFTIFNKIHDARSLCICMLVCKRFLSIIPQLDFISLSIPHHPTKARKVNSSKSLFDRLLINPFRFMLHAIKPRSLSSSSKPCFGLCCCSLAQVLKPFKGIQSLDVILPIHGSNIEKDSRTNKKMLLKWKAEFGRQLHSCVILGANSFHKMENSTTPFPEMNGCNSQDRLNTGLARGSGTLDIVDLEHENGARQQEEQEEGGLPFRDDDLKLRIVWAITCLIAASARHYLLAQMLVQHQMVRHVNISDESKQGKLCMNDDQVKDLKGSFNPLFSKFGSSTSSLLNMRTRVPALKMKMWYASEMELPVSGWMMKGATLMVVRPDEAVGDSYKVKSDGELLVGAFDGDEEHVMVCNEAIGKLMKSSRNYTLEISSF